jgi:undecaprenyl-diphosphatase
MFCFYLWAAAQIILESFPISSSGHVALLSFVCPVDSTFSTYIYVREYIGYVLHLPTAIVVAIFFAPQWSFPFIHIKRCWKLVLKISWYTALATTVTLIGYGLSIAQGGALKMSLPLPVSFFITACCLWSLRWCKNDTYEKLDSLKVIVLGAVQALAFVPGISRFAITYVVARWMRLPARRAFEVSFLIQWPLIMCAALYSVYVLYRPSIELLNLPFVLVMLGASIMAYAGLCIVSYMVKKRIMWWWGYYMLIPLALSIMLGVMNA